MRRTFVSITAADGFPLCGTLFEPRGPALGAVLISGATGVSRRYYQPYAEYLAGRGFAVLTYDYRGIGSSRWPGWRERNFTMRDWGERDLAAGLEWLQKNFPRLAKLTVGHSVGAQLLGLAANNHLVQGALSIAGQNGYWRNWPARHQPRLAAMWHVVVPAVTRLLGRLPGPMLGGEDLSRGVALEWARWCRNPHFISDESGRALREHFEDYRGPMQFYAIADDDAYAPLRAVERLAALYANAATDIRLCLPEHYGVSKIGHFGFFRRDMPVRLWHETFEWLRRCAEPQLKRAA